MLVAILPKSDICYFDVQSKIWKQLSSVQKLAEGLECYCAELIGNYLYVAATFNAREYTVCCYDIVLNVWRKLPPIPGSSNNPIGSLCHIEDHLYVIYKSSAPYRFNLRTNQWQSIASSKAVCDLSQETFCNKAAAVYKSCPYVLYGQGQITRKSSKGLPFFRCHVSLSVLFRFDPKKNGWEQKASTKTPHFGSSLFVVNNNLCVAGGSSSLNSSSYELVGSLAHAPATIEVYNDQENA